MDKVELLAPAGSLQKMKYAVLYGADAVYCGMPDFSLRVRINKFSKEDLEEAVKYVHERGKKIYVTLNIYAHNSHLGKIEEHLEYLNGLGVDAIIASDPGIISLIKKHCPGMEIHLSTQANATNSEAVRFWKELGVSRVILAREVSLSEMKEIHESIPRVELETFVHGAMCMSYSGRCILSKWMTGRSGNLGDCSQPCRWAYHEAQNTEHETKEISLVDDQERFGMDVEEDKHGTYMFNSYDMNLIEHIGEIIDSGITSLKIEGRAKSAYYLAIVVRAYRRVIDAIENGVSSEDLTGIVGEQKAELSNLAHRGYSTGFLLGEEPAHNFKNELNKGSYEFVGEVEGVNDKANIIRAHNHFSIEDKLEAITPHGNISVSIVRIIDKNGSEVGNANGGHEGRYSVELDQVLEEGSLLRKKI